MSKSKLNGVTPDEIIEEYGADSLRLYEMFMGPFDKEKLWNTDAVSGCRRFLNRFYDMVTSEKLTDEEHPEALRLTYRLLEAVAKDIELMQFNTAIAKMMEFINAFIPLEAYPKRCLKWAVQALYPFAPHIGEELWEYLGEKESITYAPFPLIDRSCLEETSATYVVQINGKLRGRLVLPKDQSEEELMKIIQKQSEIAQYIKGEVVKTVFVPNKLLNIVVK